VTDATREPAGLRLPDDTVLVHIGPHKTGTTALQAALFVAREAMAGQGVHHAGGSRNPARAAQAVTGRSSAFGSTTPSMRHWTSLAADVRRARGRRVVLSSEFLAHADPEAVRRVVDDLGPDRVHIVVTLRPLAKIIPSMWQQNVKAGRTSSLESWLRRLFPEPGGPTSDAFWTLHRHDRLLARWAAVAGLDRVTALVLDEGDRGSVLRAFEQLLGLADGTLPAVPGLANRSLTADEAEALRAFNLAYRQAGHDKELYARAIRFGAAQHLCRLEPPEGTSPIGLPAWSLDPVGREARAIADGIRATGVRVIGDPESLTWLPDATPGGGDGPALPAAVSPEVSARLAMSIAIASGRARTAGANEAEVAEAMASIATPQLIGAVVVRSRATGGRVRRRGGRVARVIVDRARTAARGVRSGTPARTAAGTDTRAGELPPGTVLVHVGPPKTGTTAVQASFHACRANLERQGVHYAGSRRHSIPPILAALGRRSFFADEPPPIRHWHGLRDEIRRSRAAHVVLSSEFLADGTPDRIEAIVDDLGRERVRVVVTLRPLARVIPSQWQQYVQSGARSAFEPWLDNMLNTPEARLSPTFWRRHRVDALIARWVDVVGADRVTAIVVDESDREMVLRTFERLVGVREGSLRLQDDVANRSLTAPEIEAVRVLNLEIAAAGLGRGFQSSVVHFGTSEYLKRFPPDPASARVDLPEWAVPRVTAIEGEMVAGIAASGVHVIGDLARLAEVRTSGRSGFEGGPLVVPVEVAARLAMGVLYATGLAEAPAPGQATTRRSSGRVVLPFAEPVEIARVPTRRVVRELRTRTREAASRRLRRGGR
jgi:hypothetical protein